MNVNLRGPVEFPPLQRGPNGFKFGGRLMIEFTLSFSFYQWIIEYKFEKKQKDKIPWNSNVFRNPTTRFVHYLFVKKLSGSRIWPKQPDRRSLVQTCHVTFVCHVWLDDQIFCHHRIFFWSFTSIKRSSGHQMREKMKMKFIWRYLFHFYCDLRKKIQENMQLYFKCSAWGKRCEAGPIINCWYFSSKHIFLVKYCWKD